MQMNISSIITGNSKAGFCRRLLEYELVHIIGTDSHSDFVRAPRIKEGLAFIRKKYGDAVINKLLFENAVKLLKNQYI